MLRQERQRLRAALQLASCRRRGFPLLHVHNLHHNAWEIQTVTLLVPEMLNHLGTSSRCARHAVAPPSVES